MSRYHNETGQVRGGKIVRDGFLALILLILFWGTWGTVKAGEQGIHLRFGAVTGRVINEGLYFKAPLIEKVVKIDVKTQKVETKILAYSKDIQTVDATIALNYHVEPSTVGKLYQEIGKDYVSRIIDPAVQESVKAATAQFTAQELIEQRPKVKDEIKSQLFQRLQGRYLIVDDVSIVNFDFSDVYEAAIEQKQKAQQDALRAENELKRIRVEAEQRIAQAQAEAEAIRLQSQAANNQNYVQLKALEVQQEAIKRWNGVLPQYSLGQSTPFINLGK